MSITETVFIKSHFFDPWFLQMNYPHDHEEDGKGKRERPSYSLDCYYYPPNIPICCIVPLTFHIPKGLAEHARGRRFF
jgi:hypothetical protein